MMPSNTPTASDFLSDEERKLLRRIARFRWASAVGWSLPAVAAFFLFFNVKGLGEEARSQIAQVSPDVTHVGWTECNRKRLHEFLERKFEGQPFATVDWDNTMILNDVGDASFLYLIDTMGFKFDEVFWGLIPKDPKDPEDARPTLKELVQKLRKMPEKDRAMSEEFQAYRYRMWRIYSQMCEQEGNRACYSWVVKIMSGMTPEEVRAVAKKAIDREIREKIRKEELNGRAGEPPEKVNRGIRYYPEMKELVEDLKKRGIDVWVVSASAQWLVEEAAGRIGIPPNRVLGMLPELDETGRIKPCMKRVTYREGKAQAIREEIGGKPVLAAGDSNTDIEMLERATGLQIVIDRGKAELMEKARKNGWLIQPKFFQEEK